jgi:valyl-tRNA synthetase
MLAQYGFKEPGDLLIQTYSDAAYKTVSEETTSIRSLSGKYAGKIGVLEPTSSSQPPAGCALQSINADAAVYLKVAGRIDFNEELKKQQKNVEDAKARAEKSKKIMSGAGWEKASNDTRTKEEEKLEDAESEVKRLQEAIKDLERLRLEK